MTRTGKWPEIDIFSNIPVLHLWNMIADTVDDHMDRFMNNSLEVKYIFSSTEHVLGCFSHHYLIFVLHIA